MHLTLVVLPALLLQDGWTALMRASVSGHKECVNVLLDMGAEVNMQDKVSGYMQCSMLPESPVVNED